ncbi:MAG: tetratricopeptide repeat protein, partial [Pseudonocardiaceae bacterium]
EMQANGLVPVFLGETSACRHAISSAGTQRQSRPGVYKIGYGPEELAELEPGNTTYRRDLSISYERLADLAREAGRSGDAETLYRQSLTVREELAELEPGNTTYRRDLSISYNKLADLAREAGQLEIARDLVHRAVGILRALHRLEPRRVDVAVEFAYALYLSAMIAVLEEQENAGLTERQEIVDVLVPFEPAGLLTARGHSLLAWVREGDSD